MDDETMLEDRRLALRRRKLIFSALLAAIALSLIVHVVFRDGFFASCKAKITQLMTGKPLVFDRSGESAEDGEGHFTENELLQLAKDIKNAGFVVQGVSQCVWTRRQRDLFGPKGSPARAEFEKVYVECSGGLCPDVRGFPTWSRGTTKFPGFRDVARIREMIKEFGVLPSVVQPQDASEPLQENLPDAKPAVPAAPVAKAPLQKAKNQKVKPKSKATVKKFSSDEEELEEEELEEEEPEEEEEVIVLEKTKKRKRNVAKPKKRREHVRGVSSYPPLVVPNMPGSGVMQIDGSFADYQAAQGVKVRESLEKPEPVEALANQMLATFSQIAHDAVRDPNAASFKSARLPQSANITDNNGMDDRRIYTEKN